MPGPRIDLHAHSTASDGTTPPEVLVREAAEAGLDVVALTDHDTTDGWSRAVEALPEGMRLVRGAEISCSDGGISLHLLAYLFDPLDVPLAEKLEAVRASRVTRAERMVEQLVADDVPVTWEQVRGLADGTVGRPHIAQALVQSGVVATIPDAFTNRWIGSHGRYWASKTELDVIEGVRLVKQAGGVPVFAHPGASARGRVVADGVIEEMAEAGLFGLEVDHVDHTPETRERLRRLASGLGLVCTGSSDFHGANKQVRLGENTTSPVVFEQIVAQASGVEVL